MMMKIKIMIMSIKSAQLKIYKAKIFIKNKLGAFDARHHQGELKKKVIIVTKHKKARRSISL